MRIPWSKLIAPAVAIPLVLGPAACGDDDDDLDVPDDVSEGVEDLSGDVSEGVEDISSEVEQQVDEGEEEGGSGATGGRY